MNEVSVSSVQVPQVRPSTRGKQLARSGVIRLLDGLVIGSLTLHEGAESIEFGSRDAAVELHAELRIHDAIAFREIIAGGSVGAGESYMRGHWSSPDLVAVMRLFTANMTTLQTLDSSGSWLGRLAWRIAHALNKNSLTGSRRNIAAHYDLGNDFFELFLDQSMMYSAAIFPDSNATLEEAALYKLDVLCEQLDLKPTDHLLEIGTGWGGLALYAATHYGCRVTTTTLSREQYEYTQKRVSELGLEQLITVLCEDYRDLDGCYDKLISIEMIEAVGHQHYKEYFSRCSSLLKPDGLMVIQAITIPDDRYHQAINAVDFIQRYIFPGGCLPSIGVISQHVAKDTDMEIINLRDITPGYADTLAHWRERFLNRLPEVRERGFDGMFIRMWEFYLCYCEGGFRERAIGTAQLTFAKPGYRFEAAASDD